MALIRRLVPLLGLAALVAGTASCGPPPPLAVTSVLGGLANPWDIAFTPEGTMLFTERSGNIDALAGGARRVLTRPADVFVQGEAGMMGLAVDPGFATNRRIYTCFATQSGGVPRDARIVRWTVDAGYTALSGRTDILTGLPLNSTGRHSGCRLRFGPDRYLYATTGDTATNTVPQSLQSLGGKVLRITTDGVAAPGNPALGGRPEIYTYGHRNPQGISWRPSDGVAFVIEHGTSRDDEINRLVPGGNYGWDPRPAGGGTLYDESRPMTDLGRYPNAIPAVWSSGSPTIAPSGGTFLSGDQWAGWDGALAVAVLKASRLQVFTSLDPGATQSTNVVTDRGRLRVAVQGPDGNLYLATDANPGSILRVTPGAVPG
jgi:aldose sugar dehydrogenase